MERTAWAPGTERALERTLSAPGTERALERTLWAHGTERALERTLWAPGTERALERTLSAPGTERALEAGLICRRPMSNFPDVSGILLHTPVTLTDVAKLTCWTHACCRDSVTTQCGSPWKNGDLGPNAGKVTLIIKSKANREKQNNNQERDTPDGNVVLVSRVHETECNRSDRKHSEIQTCECW